MNRAGIALARDVSYRYPVQVGDGVATRVQMSARAKDVLSKWYDPQLLETTLVFQGSSWGKFFGAFGQRAVTLNKVVHLTKNAHDPDTDDGIMLLGHEFFHVEHQLRDGWGSYIRAYMRGWRPWHIWAGHKHPMEVEAYRRGDEVWQVVGRRSR